MKFDKTKKGYEIFAVLFKAYEAQKKILSYMIVDPGDNLVTPSEFAKGERMVPNPADAMKMVVRGLTDEEKALYKANSMSFYKMMRSVPDSMVVTLKTITGENMNMFKVKEWLKKEFGSFDVVDSYQVLNRQLKECRPSKYKTSFEFISVMDNLNTRLRCMDKKYKPDEVQLITDVLDKITD